MFPTIVICILSIGFAAVPSNCKVYDKTGTELSSLSVVVYDEVGPISLRCDQSVNQWSVSPSLPYTVGLNATTGVISGQFVDVMETIHYNFTATNNDGSTSFTFDITVIECPYGKPLAVEHFFSEGEEFTLFDGDKQVYYFKKGSSPRAYICLPYKTYKYSSICTSGQDGWCYIRVTDKNGIVFTEFRAPENQLTYGTFDMIPTAKPVISSVTEPVVRQVMKSVKIFISASTTHTEFAFSPALPSTAKFDGYLSSITGFWKEKGVYTYNVTCSNSVGSDSFVLQVFIDECGEPYRDLTFTRKKTIRGETLNVTNASGENLLSTEFSGMSYSDFTCVLEGEYFIHIEGLEASGWTTGSLFVHSDNDEIGEYVVPKGQHEWNEKIVIKKLITTTDNWSYHVGDLSDDWTSGKYREKNWKNGKSGEWGEFDESKIVLFRKQIELNERYGSMMLEIESEGYIELFVNGMMTWSQLTNGIPHRVTLRGSLFDSKSIIGIRLKHYSSFDYSIHFGMRMYPTWASTVVRSENGVASGNPEDIQGSHRSEKAFDMDTETYWSVDSLPATVTYMFNNSSVAVNSIYLFVDDWYVAGLTEMSVEGITGDNETIPLVTMTTPSFLSNEAYREIRLNNEIAYSGYRFHFNGKRIGFIHMRDIRLRVSNIQTCKKKIGLSSLETGYTHYKKCPLGRVGIRQMRCENVDNVATWIDDRSSCVSRFPDNGIAFVDSWFRLTNVTVWNWEKNVDGLKEVIIDQLTVKKKEINVVMIRDESTELNPIITVMLRFELEEAIGDYVLNHMKKILPDIPRLFREEMGTMICDASAESLNDPILYEPIHWGSIIGSILKDATLVIVSVLITMCFTRRRNGVKNLSRRGTKKGDDQSLLQDQLSVCFAESFVF